SSKSDIEIRGYRQTRAKSKTLESHCRSTAVWPGMPGITTSVIRRWIGVRCEPSGQAGRRSCTSVQRARVGWAQVGVAHASVFGVVNPIDAKKLRCRRRFLRFFPHGFSDERYLAWERDYKAEAHARWTAKLSARRFAEFLAARQYDEVAVEALRIEARTNLLFSFEKMALRDAVRTASGAQRFAEGLYA